MELDRYLSSVRRKLDRVGQQIPKDLLQAICVAEHGGRFSFEVNFDLNVLRFGRWSHHIDGCFQDRCEFERMQFQIEIAGDDPRNVENVVNDLCLRFGVSIYRLDGASEQPSLSSEPPCSMRDQPRMAVNGVRSSWETVARNSSFSRFDSSALALAVLSRSSSPHIFYGDGSQIRSHAHGGRVLIAISGCS